MARLRTAPEVVAAAINVRSEGLGIWATGRCFDKSHTTLTLPSLKAWGFFLQRSDLP